MFFHQKKGFFQENHFFVCFCGIFQRSLYIESDYNTSGFLEDITKKDDELNRYKLGYKLREEDDKVYGFWGFVKFVIYKDTEKYIFSPFFKTKNLNEDEDVKTMLDNIKEELFYSLFTNKNISLSSYKIKKQRDENQSWWSFINIFELLYKDLEKSITDIHENPKYINSINYEVKKYNSGKITIDNRFINDSIKKGYYDLKEKKLNIYGKNIIQRKIIGEYNNISNKIFIDLNQILINKLDRFLKIGKNKIKNDYLQTIKEKRENISSKRISFINKLGLNLTKLSNYTSDYQHLDSKYKKFVINYLKLFFMLDLLNGEIMLANKSIDQIYEYWTLIKTRDILYELIETTDKKPIFSIKKHNDSLIFELGDNSKVEIKGNNGECTIIYKFQNSISSITNDTKPPKNDLRIISAGVRPDIFVNIKNKTFEEKYFILDAKYSTDDIGNIYKERFENLYKYKAGIVQCNDLYFDEELQKWEGNMKTIIDEVIAIYPGEKEEKLAKLYKKYISDIGFGGLVMKPGNEEDIKEYFSNKIN